MKEIIENAVKSLLDRHPLYSVIDTPLLEAEKLKIQSLLDGSITVADLAEGWKQQAREYYKHLKNSSKLYKGAAERWTKDATTGQKVTAAFIAAGATLGAAKRGRKEWKRSKGKPAVKRLAQTGKGVAKGAFGGAISGTVTGYTAGKAIDYLRNEQPASGFH